MSVTLSEQIECVERELKYRERVYGRRVADGKMTAKLAEREMVRMTAVLETLRRLAQPVIERDEAIAFLERERDAAERIAGQLRMALDADL